MIDFISGKEIEPPKIIVDILEIDEKILYSYQTAGIGGKFSGLESIIVTDKRIIKYQPLMFGLRESLFDYRFENMTNIRMNKGFFRSDLFIYSRPGIPNLNINNIPDEGAKQLFKVIQNEIDEKTKYNLSLTQLNSSHIQFNKYE